MYTPYRILAVACLLLLLAVVAGADDAPPACRRPHPRPETLSADRLTVLLSGYSSRRIPLLLSLASLYTSLPLVSSVLILWSNPTTPPPVLRSRFSSLPPSASLLRHPSPSLNSRFLPRPGFIRTRAVLIADDDVKPDPAAVALAFSLWQQQQLDFNRSTVVGFFGRSHHLDLQRRQWAYTFRPDRYSIVLTKIAILGTRLLYRYSCSPEFADARELVDRVRNCEDILLNFVAAIDSGVGPLLVDGGGVRDWGDPRNRGFENGTLVDEDEVRRVGLSSRNEHWLMRGRCITEFHRLLGVMPLKFSHGKVVAAVRDAAMCRRAGELVPCDRW